MTFLQGYPLKHKGGKCNVFCLLSYSRHDDDNMDPMMNPHLSAGFQVQYFAELQNRGGSLVSTPTHTLQTIRTPFKLHSGDRAVHRRTKCNLFLIPLLNH